MVLDTSAYSALRAGRVSIAQYISEIQTIVMPVAALAELRFGFLKGKNTEKNEIFLKGFLANPRVSVAVAGEGTAELYSKLAYICQKRGRSLSHNDIWIAACALELEETLLTLDIDFEALREEFGDRLVVLS
jgi:tRNA(fMet)-specific endonuclease VapC